MPAFRGGFTPTASPQMPGMPSTTPWGPSASCPRNAEGPGPAGSSCTPPRVSGSAGPRAALSAAWGRALAPRPSAARPASACCCAPTRLGCRRPTPVARLCGRGSAAAQQDLVHKALVPRPRHDGPGAGGCAGVVECQARRCRGAAARGPVAVPGAGDECARLRGCVARPAARACRRPGAHPGRAAAVRAHGPVHHVDQLLHLPHGGARHRLQRAAERDTLQANLVPLQQRQLSDETYDQA